MKIRTDIPNDFYAKGFTTETDPFKKADLAQRLTKLFSKLEHGTVSILDGRWGTGKTVFARQWQHHLESQSVPCIYFDAFAADYVDSPFRAVASAFVRAAKEARSHDKVAYEKFLNAASKAAKIIAVPTAKMAVKALTLGIVGSAELDAMKTAAEEFASGLGDVSEAALKAMLEEQAGDEASFEALRESLATLPNLLAKKIGVKCANTEQGDEPFSPSLVVIIDELDRCRPDFALGVLEVLKHFFRAERVHFVLVTSLNHLLLSVHNRYGVGEAAGEYVQKFYDFLIPFEERQQDGSGTNASRHAKLQLQSMLNGANTQDGSYLIEDVGQFVSAYDLSLRQAERVVANVVLAQVDFSKRTYRPGMLVALLAIIKAQQPALFSNIKRSCHDTAQLKTFIELGNWSGASKAERLLTMVRFYCDPEIDEDDPEFKGYGSSLWDFNFHSRLDILPFLANDVIDRFG